MKKDKPRGEETWRKKPVEDRVANGLAPIGEAALVLDPRILLSSPGAPPRPTRRFSGFFCYFVNLFL
jgi:hypothetical protein